MLFRSKKCRTQGCYIPKLINTKNIYNDGKKKKILKRKKNMKEEKKSEEGEGNSN